MLFSVQALAQSTDSVKVRLRTSAGAEIGIDDDISSTNLLTKKVSVGPHVVVVTYGTRYKKEFNINVTQAKTEYDFTIDGKLDVKSLPTGMNLYIDGVKQGRTPLSLPILGDHNLRLEGDPVTYYDLNERVSISPFETVEKTFTMSKRPPRTYGMVLLNYMPVSGSPGFGLTLAIVKRWGMYIRLTSAGKGDPDQGKHDKYYYGNNLNGPGVYEKDTDEYWAANGGVIFRLSKFAYFYAGSGYGSYSRELKGDSYGKVHPYKSKGVMADGGIILKWKALIGQVGYNRILGEGTPDPFGSVYVGLGITIHKQRKDK